MEIREIRSLITEVTGKMMMGPESYFEKNLRGRGQEEKSLITADAEDIHKRAEGPKLTLLNMRWWYDDSAAFGVVEGDTFAELMVMDENGRFFFILVYRMTPYEKILISEYAMFDIFKHCFNLCSDMEYELVKIMNNAFEEYEYDIREIPAESMEKSKFCKALMLARYAMHNACAMGYLAEEKANDFVREFLGEDLLKMDIPEVTWQDSEDDKRSEQGFIYRGGPEDHSNGTTCIFDF